MAKTKKKKRSPKSRASAKASGRASRKAAKRSAAGKSRRKTAARTAKRKVTRSKVRRPTPRRKGVVKSRRSVAKPVKPVAKKAKRLAPRERHVVESDETRERVGDADDKAFVGTDTTEDEAQELGEEFVRSVTSGEEAESEMEEEEATEEQGGPFVVTSASTEFGFGTDESNPADAEKAPFPQVSPAVSPRTDAEDEDQ
jgi:hypothetical protein